MKRIISLSLVIVLLFTLSFTAFADTPAADNQVVIDDYIITFDENTVFSAEEQQMLAEQIVYLFNEGTESQTYGLVCNMFGHKTTTEPIEVTEHCVRDTSPRCLLSYCNLTACSRCDYAHLEIIGSIYIDCCA